MLAGFVLFLLRLAGVLPFTLWLPLTLAWTGYLSWDLLGYFVHHHSFPPLYHGEHPPTRRNWDGWLQRLVLPAAASVLLALVDAGVWGWWSLAFVPVWLGIACAGLLPCRRMWMEFNDPSSTGWSIGFAGSDLVCVVMLALPLVLWSIRYDAGDSAAYVPYWAIGLPVMVIACCGCMFFAANSET